MSNREPERGMDYGTEEALSLLAAAAEGSRTDEEGREQAARTLLDLLVQLQPQQRRPPPDTFSMVREDDGVRVLFPAKPGRARESVLVQYSNRAFTLRREGNVEEVWLTYDAHRRTFVAAPPKVAGESARPPLAELVYAILKIAGRLPG